MRNLIPGFVISHGRANVAQHPRDPPDHVEDRSIHGHQRAAGVTACHPGQNVPDQVQGPLPHQVGAAERAQMNVKPRGLGRLSGREHPDEDSLIPASMGRSF